MEQSFQNNQGGDDDPHKQKLRKLMTGVESEEKKEIPFIKRLNSSPKNREPIEETKEHLLNKN